MRLFAVSCVIVAPVWPQRDAPARFEVASIHPVATGPGAEVSRREEVQVTPTSVWLKNASLSFAIQWAYDVKFYQVAGPEWLKDQRWDILAKTEAAHSEAELRAAMRVLLADRFQLVLHAEKQPRPVYALVVSNGRNRLQPSRPGAASSFSVTGGDFVFSGVSMTDFAERLSDFATVDRPVVNATGLAGTFDFRLESAASAIRGGEGPSIFTAVSEIGLQMKPASEALEILVVDSATRSPSEN